MTIKLDTDGIMHITLFESTPGARVKDCLIDEDKIIFVVQPGQASIAIGRNGANVKNIQRAISKQVEVIEFSEDPARFVANIFRPINLENEYISEKSDGKKVLYISPSKNSVLTKMKLKKARLLISRYFKIDSVEFG